MIIFSPQWHTDAALSDAVEGDPVNRPLIAVSTGTTILEVGETDLQLGFAASAVTGVKFNGTSSAYTASGTSIFFSALTTKTTIEVETNSELIYTLIGGKLPKGLIVSQQGILSGTPQGIKDEQGEIYTFTVRVSNGQTVRDRTFRILIFPVAQTAVWNMSGLPLETSDATLSSISYRVLGEVKRGESYSFSIDVSHPDGDKVVVSIVNSNGVVVRDKSYNTGLPSGLSLNGTSIEGVVLPSTPPGKYFFTLSVVAPSSPAPIPAMIEVLPLRTASFKRPVKMQWVTAAGSLGVLVELQVCNLSVMARNPNGGAVNYNILSGTGALPPGLSLNPQTGDIEGQVLFVSANSSYSFTIRASSESIFADRTFSIDIKDFFSAENVSEVSLKFQGRDRRLALKGYAELLPPDWLYRAGDLNFGLVTEPYIHVAKGLFTDQTLSLLDYRENITCTFGPHAISSVKDSSGKVIYDVLYRKIIDPMDYDPNGNENRLDGLIIDYKQSKEALQLHPMSIWNMRYDLLTDYGLNVNDFLPEWMDKDTNLPGFKTAFAVAYLQPGSGVAALDLLDESIAPNGHTIKFDRVLLSRVGTNKTLFDLDGLKMIPIYVQSGVGSVTTGRWTGNVDEIFTVEILTDENGTKVAKPDSLVLIDQATINMNVEASTISFPTVAHPRMFFFFIKGAAPEGLSISNAPVGTNLVIGPFVHGVASISSNGATIDQNSLEFFVSQGLVKNNATFTAGQEIIVSLSETTFDDETDENTKTLFDYKSVPVGKYIKLSNEFKRYP